ncbi:uncharacterized protein LAESUDRAFT_739231 [Laetiporus sulphureus 93-53]|uniref:Uncharacterized protein n=1 Tax=Laetiporus sulphureus 93-53 TaxID=1314785 RepID=A0A165BLF5_9APHY|nr:uncharacterized protein LAESUDRAFT_739231 [Laetiporus sulphureus 93-53]KZT01268.1 hypothetical protein LAESUDRAFT_739231 [Laetiporus sulphureus 93-53]
MQPQGQDSYEGDLKIPTSVLDRCKEFFLTADEKCQKASTQFFMDTINMMSAGERQHYTLTLIHHLFQHLPSSATVGLLYDIACQLHCSCINWGFLGDVIDRRTFAISIFHTYGHQWSCQVIYHPRKCIGFGLTDG